MTHSKRYPLVSVMIPYYNCKPYIAETVESVEQQTYPNIEIIIVDDGSGQEDAAYLKAYLVDKPHIILRTQPNLGVAAARNRAAEVAEGEYFLFLDADDTVLPEYIEKAVGILESRPGCKLVYPQGELFDAEEGIWQIPEYTGFESLLLGNKFPVMSVHRAADYAALGGFDETFKTHEDWDYWIRLLQHGGEVCKIPEILIRYRKRPDHSSLVSRLMAHPELAVEDWQHIYNKHNPLFIKNRLSYWELVQAYLNAKNLEAANLSLREEVMSFEIQNQELQMLLAKILQQTAESAQNTVNLQKQIDTLSQRFGQYEDLNHQLRQYQQQIETLQNEVEHLSVERNNLSQNLSSLSQSLDSLNHHRSDLEHHLNQEMVRLAKHKGLWSVKLIKPLIQTEKAVSSANRYRKGFRLLVREKGSIGKAYQHLRRAYRQTRTFKTVKQVLKSVPARSVTVDTVAQQQPMPAVLAQSVTKRAEQTCALKVAIIAEMSIPQCKKYRVIQKQEMLEAKGIPCSVTAWTDYDEARKQISLASVVIFYRVPGFDSVMSLIDECRRLKIKTFWDVDDLIFDEGILKNSSTINSLNKEEREGIINGARLYRKAMLACDEGIASTSGLAEAMREAGLGTVHTIENALDKETLATAEQIKSRPKHSDGLIRIIYGSGTKTHNIDFMEVAPALAETLKNNPDVRFRCIGFLDLPDYFSEVKNQIEHIPFCSYSEYLAHLAECDISIAPLENFIFNDAKSNIKYLEASVVGVASICSPRAAFADVIQNGSSGILADNTAQWVWAFNTLIKNKDLRLSMAEAARTNVLRRYSLGAVGGNLVAAVTSEAFRKQDKTKILTFNVYYHPQSFGGATVVAEQINKLLAADSRYEVFAVTTLPVTHYLPPYSVIRYEYQNVTVFGVAVPPEHSAEYENARFQTAAEKIAELVRPDIAHIHCIQGIGVGIVDVCRKNGIKTIATMHDAWWICPNQFMLDHNNRFQENWNLADFPERHRIVGGALAKIDMVVAPSRYFAQLHENKAKRAVSVNKNGVIRPKGEIRKRKPDTVRFGYVGGMTEIKGVHLILEAFKKYRFENTQLVIVDNMLNMGSQSFFDSQFQGVGNYKIVPAYNQDNIDEFFSGIDVLLFPTQWKESFGLTVREAMLRNVWVIATDAGGVAEDIIDGKNGIIIPFDSGVEELSDAIRKVCRIYQKMEDGAVIDLPKAHIRTFEEQKEELSEMYQALL